MESEKVIRIAAGACVGAIIGYLTTFQEDSYVKRCIKNGLPYDNREIKIRKGIKIIAFAMLFGFAAS